MELNKIYNMDCLEGMAMLPDASVDMVLCDLPYGTTQCKWDVVIPFKPLWMQYNRIIKENGAIVLFSAQPFTTDLINSNRKMFRYEIIWEKTQVAGFLNAKKMPLRTHENICVFYKKAPTYNPIKYTIDKSKFGTNRSNSGSMAQYSEFRKPDYLYKETGERYPGDVIKFSNWNGVLFGNNSKATKHPTAKPVPLLEYLIKTYSNPNDLILDNCIGSGSTAIAAYNTGRRFIGFEKDVNYFNIAKDRIATAKQNLFGLAKTA